MLLIPYLYDYKSKGHKKLLIEIKKAFRLTSPIGKHHDIPLSHHCGIPTVLHNRRKATKEFWLMFVDLLEILSKRDI